METAVLLKRVQRLIDALVPKVDALQQTLTSGTFAPTDVSLSLDAVGEALLNLEAFLTPAYVIPNTGVKFSNDDSAAIAKLTTGMATSPLPQLVGCLVDILMHSHDTHSSELSQPASRSSSSVSGSGSGTGRSSDDPPTLAQQAGNAAVCGRVCTVLTRVLMLVHVTLLHMETKRREYVRRLHTVEFFPRCLAILSLSTQDFSILTTGSPSFLSDPNDRICVFLCCAVFSCTLGDYCHSVYGDVRWSSDVCEEITNRPGGEADPRPSKREVWAQLRTMHMPKGLARVTQLLTTAAQVGTLYRQQSPLYQSLLGPSLGLESLVRVRPLDLDDSLAVSRQWASFGVATPALSCSPEVWLCRTEPGGARSKQVPRERPHPHPTLTPPSPHPHPTLTTPHPHNTLTPPSPHPHHTLTPPSPHPHPTLTPPSPQLNRDTEEQHTRGTWAEFQRAPGLTPRTPSETTLAQVTLQLSQWMQPATPTATFVDIGDAADGPLRLLRSTLEASAGSVDPRSTAPHLTPLLNASLHTLAALWGLEGRVSRGLRREGLRPLLQRCLRVLASVAEAERAGRRVDGPRSARQVWGMWDISSRAPSVAVDVLSALHVLVEDEHMFMKGKGAAKALLPKHLAAWECCVRIALQAMSPTGKMVCLVPAFTCAAGPLALLWGSPGLASHAPARTLLRVWKAVLRSLHASLGDSDAAKTSDGWGHLNSGIAAICPILPNGVGNPSLWAFRGVLHMKDLLPKHPSPGRYCPVHAASKLAVATEYTSRFEALTSLPRGFLPPHTRTLHNVLWMLRTLVAHHTQCTAVDPVTAPVSNQDARKNTGCSTPPDLSSSSNGSSGSSSSSTAGKAYAAFRSASAAAADCTGAASAAAFVSAQARSRLAVLQLLPTGLSLIRSTLHLSLVAMAGGAGLHMLTDLLLPTEQLIELLLDIVAWPVSDDSSCVDIESGPGMPIRAEDFVSWEVVCMASHALHACWLVALSCDVGAVHAHESDVSLLLHGTTRKLARLVQHRFHDGVVGGEALGAMAGLFVREISGGGGSRDPRTFPALLTQVMRRAAANGACGSNSSGSAGSGSSLGGRGGMLIAKGLGGCSQGAPSLDLERCELSLDEPEGARCLRGMDDLAPIFSSGVFPVLESLARTTCLPGQVSRELLRVLIRILFWLRAALVPLCALGSGRATWRTSYADRRLLDNDGRPWGMRDTPDFAVLHASSVYGILGDSKPLFDRLSAALREATKPSHWASPQGRWDPLPQVPLMETLMLINNLFRHAMYIIVGGKDCIGYGLAAGDSPAVAYMKAYRTIPPDQRLEAACLQGATREVRVGCCNLDCKVVDTRLCHGEADVPLVRCSQCHSVSYCGRACQKAAWAAHKHMCALLKNGRARRGV
ncbi:MAG: hypothetical protein WDW36_009264 [Sanguina aurantia]